MAHHGRACLAPVSTIALLMYPSTDRSNAIACCYRLPHISPTAATLVSFPRHAFRFTSQTPVVIARHGFPVVAKRHVRSLELHRSERHCRQSNERHATVPNVIDTSEKGLDRRDNVAFTDTIATTSVWLPARLRSHTIPDHAEPTLPPWSNATATNADRLSGAKPACAANVSDELCAGLSNGSGIRPKCWWTIPRSIGAIDTVVPEPPA